jgi:hypothetical protein
MGSYLYEVKLGLQRILQKLDVIDAKVSRLPHVQVKTTDKLLSSLVAVRNIGRPASAAEVSMTTGKARAIESSYLNQLCRMGLLEKRRIGRKVVFSLSSEGLELFECSGSNVVVAPNFSNNNI